MTNQLKADIMLVIVTLSWGISYILIDISLTELGAFNLNSLRFLIAFIVAACFSFNKIKKTNKTTLLYAALLGVILLLVYVGATYGVRYTSLSNVGFLCALSVVIVPILAFFVKGQKPEKKLIIVVAVALLGIALLTLNQEFKPAVGDILCIMCAFFYSVHLLVVESAVKNDDVDAYQLGVYQLGFSGIYQLMFSSIFEKPVLPGSSKVWAAVLFLAIFCTGLAFIVQTIAQKYTTATHVGVIYSLEPVFAGFAAYFIAGEVLSTRGYIGAALLLSSIFIMEIDIKRIVNLWKKENKMM